jgi:methionyl-tRNA synthetase
VEIPKTIDDAKKKYISHVRRAFDTVGAALEQGNFREAIHVCFSVADEGNKFINDAAPWVSIKTDKEKAAADLAVAVYAIHCLSILSAPFLPRSAKKIARALGIDEIKTWNAPEPILYSVKEVEPLYKRIEDSEVEYQKSLLKGDV